jgi:hypothetical protein
VIRYPVLLLQELFKYYIFPFTIMGTLFYLSHQSSVDVGIDWFYGMDKILHSIAYGVLCISWVISLFVNKVEKFAMRAFLFTSAYGIFDEFHQYFVPGRTPDPFDWMADCAGALAALFFCLLLFRRFSFSLAPSQGKR